MNRRALLALAALTGASTLLRAQPSPPAAPPFDRAEFTIAALHAALSSDKTTSVALTRACLERIAALDKSGPCLNAVIELNPDAIAIARSLDADRRATSDRP